LIEEITNKKRNIVSFYLIVTAVIIIYSIIHYKIGGINFYLPFFVISWLGFTFSFIYFFKTYNYKKAVLFSFISGAIVSYAAFLQGGIDKTGFIWSVLLISISYFLMETRTANIFSFLYTFILGFTAILHLAGIISLPYNHLVYLTIFISIFTILYVGNSVIKETVKNLTLLHKAANYDSLTGVCNRKKLVEILKKELYRAKRYNRPLSVLLLDIDDFKKINDTYGHNFGDNVLKDFAKIIRMSIRATDYIGRWGGEEFIVLLPETDKKNAVAVAEKIRTLTENYFEEVYEKKITVSIGLADFRNLNKENIDYLISELIEMADRALYKAKKTGKNKVVME
jgi:diguanylate cyclase (GGDEF)-like protein